MGRINKYDEAEFAGQIIDMLEDYLEEKGITPEMLQNEERNENDINAAIIFGNDYDIIADTIKKELKKHNLIKSEDTEGKTTSKLNKYEKDEIVGNIYKSMKEVLNKINGFNVTEKDVEKIKKKAIISTFRNWKIF